MLDFLSENILLILAALCFVAIVILSLYKPKPKENENEKEVEEIDTTIQHNNSFAKTNKTLEEIEQPKQNEYDELMQNTNYSYEEKKEPEQIQMTYDEVSYSEPVVKEKKNTSYLDSYDTDFGIEEEYDLDFNSSEPKTDLDNLILQMQEDLKKTPNTVDEFEDEQEKTAIISYTELKKAMDENRITTYQDEYEENSLREHARANEELIVKDLETPMTTEDRIDYYEETKFKPSEFISPISGKQETTNNYQKVEKFDDDDFIEEETLDEDFLNSLVDFRNKLN